MSDLVELKADIASAKEDLAKAELDQDRELVLMYVNRLTELLKEQNRLQERARAGTPTHPDPCLPFLWLVWLGSAVLPAVAGVIRGPHRFPLLCRL